MMRELDRVVQSHGPCSRHMVSPSLQASTPVHLHPLSPDELPPTSRSRRPRAPTQDGATTDNPTQNSYFTLKADVGNTDARQNWDGSVRGLGKATRRDSSTADLTLHLNRKQSTASLATHLQRSPASSSQHPRFVVAAQYDANYLVPPSPTARTRRTSEVLSPAVAQVLAHKWHEYSDEAVQSAIAHLTPIESPSDADPHPYHTALRTLSSALHNLSRVRLELEESRKLLEEKQKAGRQRAETLLQELSPSEQEVARRVIQSIFTDDDERRHRVERRDSLSVHITSPYIRFVSLTLFFI